jgi:hypothetical protein
MADVANKDIRHGRTNRMSAELGARRKAAPGYAFLRRTLVRMLKMGAAWGVIGMAVGFSNGIYLGGGPLHLLAQVIAGTVLFPMLGLILGIVLDRPRESLAGSAIGLIAAVIAMQAGARIEVGSLTSLGLAAGGIFGATVCLVERLVVLAIRCARVTLQAAFPGNPNTSSKESSLASSGPPGQTAKSHCP